MSDKCGDGKGEPVPAKQHSQADDSRPCSQEQPEERGPTARKRLNLDDVAISQDFAATAGVTRVIGVVPIRKPRRSEWIRVHESYSLAVGLLNVEQELWVVSRKVMAEVVDDAKPVSLAPTITRRGAFFFWPVPVIDSTGRVNSWHASAVAAAQHARKHWVRVSSNMPARQYDIHLHKLDSRMPEWPDQSMEELVEQAVLDRLIDDREHHVLKHLRGEL